MSSGGEQRSPADGLAQGLQRLGLSLDADRQRQLLEHLELIARWNRVYNLTAVRDTQEMLTHHLLDSLSVVAPLQRHLAAQVFGTVGPTDAPGVSRPRLPLPDQAGGIPHLLDVGSGAGLPGVSLAIALPAERPVRVTCVDAVMKKAGFIRQVAAELGLPHLSAVHGRIEDLKLPAAQVITCRAFASLADIVRLTSRHLAPGGVWMLMKGHVPEDEMRDLPEDVEVFHVELLTVPFLDAQRCLVWMRLRTSA